MVGRRCATALLAVGFVAGCASRQTPGDVEIPLEELGRFSFAIETRDGVRMSGLLDVSLDTIVARSELAPCRVTAEQSTSAAFTYECRVPGTPGVKLLLDRRHPVRRSTWSVLMPVRKKRDVCVAFRTWENGTQTCTRSVPEEYIEQVKVSGELVVTR
jgi:hypothetical protein